MEEFLETVEPRYTVNIDFSLFGIRNLVIGSERPRVRIRMTNLYPDEEKTEEIMINDEWKEHLDLIETSNPNFGKMISFANVELVKEPLCWPYIEVLIDDQAGGMFGGGCEHCFTTISLVSFAKEIVGMGHDLLYADAQLHRN